MTIKEWNDKITKRKQKREKICTKKYGSFILPVILLLIVFAMIGIYPFGDQSFLAYDMRVQYVSFFSFFQDNIHDITNFLYSFQKTNGTMIGLVGYYLMSPINLLFLLGNVVDMISWVVLVKIGLCGVTCFFYLKAHTEAKEKVVFLFFLAIAYALSSYAIAYSFNVMWLDGVILAPLICFGIDQLVRKGNVGWYISFMALAVILNYYIGCMIGIYSAIYFAWAFLKENTTIARIKKEKRKIGLFLLGALLALGVSSILLIPAINDLAGTRSQFSYQEVLSLKTNCSFEGILSRLFCGSYQEIDQNIDGCPNLYASILTVFLVGMYFTNPKEKKRNKILTGIVLGIFFLSFWIQGLNWIWHGFNKPGNFPFRYAFLFVLFFLTIAAESIQKLPEKCKMQQIGLPVILIAGIGIILGIREQIEFDWLFINIGILLFYAILLPYHSSKGIKILFGVILTLELIGNAWNILGQVEYEKRQETITEIEQVQEVVDATKEKQESVSRIEKTFETYENDPMLYGYMGISHYSSNVKLDTLGFYRKLGFQQDWIMIRYRSGNTVFADSFCNIQYILDKADNRYTNYPVIDEKNGIVIRENDAVFPFSYLVTEKIKDISFEDKTVIENQNQIYQAVSGTEEKVLTEVKIQKRNLINLTADYLDNWEIWFYRKKDNQNESFIWYQIKTEEAGPVYIWLDNLAERKIDIYTNGQIVIENEAQETGSYLLGNYEAGEEIEVKIVLKEDLMLYHSVAFYQEDVSKTETLKQKLQPMQIQEFQNGKVKGTIEVGEENALLYLGVPYNKGWTVKVDGEKVETICVLEDQMVIDLTKGTHEIEMTFFPRGLKLGIFVCALSIACSIALGIDYLLQQKKEKKK